MRRSGVTLAVSALVSALVAGLLTGCGNIVTTEIVGMAAVTRSSDGSPVLLVKVCKQGVDTVSVFASREGLSANEPNPLLASWTSPHLVSGTIRIPVEQPPAGWTRAPSTPEGPAFGRAQLYIVEADASQKDVAVTQVSFRGRALKQLPPGQVLVRSSHVWSGSQFERAACPSDHD